MMRGMEFLREDNVKSITQGCVCVCGGEMGREKEKGKAEGGTEKCGSLFLEHHK